MTDRIVQKIHSIRQQPEHIRLQYALGAVAICMIFVIGVWILTLRQGFLGASPEMSKGTEQAKEVITNVGNSVPSTDSLRALEESSRSLRVNSNNNDAEQFINQELERSATPNTTTPK